MLALNQAMSVMVAVENAIDAMDIANFPTERGKCIG